MNELTNNGIYQYTNNNNVTNRPDVGYWGTLLTFKSNNYNDIVTMQMSLSHSGNIYTRSKTNNDNFEIWKCHNGINDYLYMINGYICFQNGLILQWHRHAPSTTNWQLQGAHYTTSIVYALRMPICYTAVTGIGEFHADVSINNVTIEDHTTYATLITNINYFQIL